MKHILSENYKRFFLNEEDKPFERLPMKIAKNEVHDFKQLADYLCDVIDRGKILIERSGKDWKNSLKK